MKRKIAILLSAVMVASAMPMSAMADSSNSVSSVVTVSSNEIVASAGSIVIRPQSDYTGGKFYIELENATFEKSAVDALATSNTFDSLGQTFDDINNTYGGTNNALRSWAEDVISKEGTPLNRIPYKLTWVNETTVSVELLTFTGDYIGSSLPTDVFEITPYVEISLNNIIKAGGSGTITATIDGNQTGITDGTYTIGTINSGSGSTTTTVSKVTNFEDECTLEDIVIKENIAGTFKFSSNDVITLRLNSGFVFANTSNAGIVLKGVRNAEGSVTPKVELTSSNVMTISGISGLDLNSSLVSSIAISGIKVAPADEDKNYGTVKLTISGNDSGITQETIEVANRQTEGLYMEVIGDPTTIIAGRTYAANSDLSEDSFVTAKVRFSESFADAWGESKLDFTVPEGVQITGVTFSNLEGFTDTTLKSSPLSATAIYGTSGAGYSTQNGSVLLTNNGRTLRFAKGFKTDSLDTSKVSSFEMVLKLSVVAGYEGDITLSASGAGASEGEIKDVVIAKAIQPISIETNSTDVNLGYSSYNTADISIIENVPGALLAGKNIKVSISSTFENEIAITNADVTTTSEELTIKKVSNDGTTLTITIDNQSYNEAATIKISNVQVGTTRSIPYGSYELVVSGDAVINNYNASTADGSAGYATAESKSNQNFAYNNEVSHYTVDSYINLVTATGTLDNTVKVTIGEPTVLINDEAHDMDVAPYIQSASNSTLVPLRFVTVALGLDDVDSADESSKISFDANTKTATIYYGSGTSSKVIQFQAGSNIMNIAGTQIAMENGVTAEIKDGRMFVPFRALGQALGVSVSWDEDTRTAIYNAK